MNFTKLFNSILDSTIWQESKETKLVWITMLAMSDRNGCVFASVPGLAVRSGVTLTEAEAALVCLLAPDKYSRTKTAEGRRIEAIDGGWRLINHGKYRALLSAEERREYNRRKQQEHRRKAAMRVNDTSLTVNDNKQCQHSTEAEADTEGEATASLGSTVTDKSTPPLARVRGGVGGERAPRFTAPTIEQIKLEAAKIGLSAGESDRFYAHYSANGWMVGRNRMRSWEHALVKWKLNAGTYGPHKQATRTTHSKNEGCIGADRASDYRLPIL